MVEKFYLDACVWIDYYSDRKDCSKDLGEIAFHLLSRLLASGSRIIVSDFLLMELEKVCSLDEIRGLTIHFEKMIEKVCVSEEQINFARCIAENRGIPKGDAVHAIIARDCGAILVSRDKHFQFLTDICTIVKPEELI